MAENTGSVHNVVTDRIEALGPDFVRGLADPIVFDEDHRQTRKMLYMGLPTGLSEIEASTLAIYVADETLTNRPFIESPKKSSVRALRYIGGVAWLHGDQDTAANAASVLKQQYGLRGKLAAISLWYERTIQN